MLKVKKNKKKMKEENGKEEVEFCARHAELKKNPGCKRKKNERFGKRRHVCTHEHTGVSAHACG